MSEVADRAGREPVIQAGLKLLNEVGLEKLTLKLIADELGIRAPTLYWRFRNKQDLIDEMATRVLVDCMAQSAIGHRQSWRQWTLQFGSGLRAALLRYRDGARMVSGTHLTEPNTLYDAMEAGLAIFAAAGHAPADAVTCMMTVYNYVIGFTIEQQAVVSPQGERDPRYDDAARADGRHQPSPDPQHRPDPVPESRRAIRAWPRDDTQGFRATRGAAQEARQGTPQLGQVCHHWHFRRASPPPGGSSGRSDSFGF